MTHPPASRALPHPCAACALRQSFCPTGEIRGVIDRLKTSVLYDAGFVAFDESEPCHSVFIIGSGRVKLMTGSRTGRTLLLRLAGEGELLAAADAVAGVPYSYSAVTVEPTVMSSIPRETFLRLVATYPELGQRLTKSLCEEYRLARRETRFLGFGETTTSRLARLLLSWAGDDGTKSHRPAPLPSYVTHADLAQAIGATRETVTRILSDFRQRGIITRDGDSIVIRDAEALSGLAGG